MVYMPPEEPYERDGRMGFYVTRPEGSRQGPLVDASMLRYLRAKGWRLHRIIVTGYCLWDRYGTVNGRLVPLTVPAKVRTDAAGYAVSATGRVLTDHNGRPSRSTTHPKAVQIGKERVSHPNVDRYYPIPVIANASHLCPNGPNVPVEDRTIRRFGARPDGAPAFAPDSDSGAARA